MDEQPQTMPLPQYADGSRVVCADGQTLGEVVATFREYLIVEQGYFFPVNFYVPYAAIAEAGGGDIVLSLSGHDAMAQGWHLPPEDPVVVDVPAPVAPPAAPVATTAAPEVPAMAAPVDEPLAAEADPAAPSPEPVETTTDPPTVATAGASDISPETKTVEAGKPSADERDAEEVIATSVETVTTAAPVPPVVETLAAGEAVEVQSFQPDASVPPPDEPEEAGTVSAAPSFVGIPGRRLTDAELWSLLEPKDAPSESGEQPETTDDEKDTPDKPGEASK